MILSKFRKTQNFDKIILNFVKFKENFANMKFKISQKFGKKFREIPKMKILQPHYVVVE